LAFIRRRRTFACCVHENDGYNVTCLMVEADCHLDAVWKAICYLWTRRVVRLVGTCRPLPHLDGFGIEGVQHIGSYFE